MDMRVAPLPGSFMLTGIIGFFISVLVISRTWPSYAFAFSLVFVLMFLASIVSMTYADVSALEGIDKKKKIK